MQIYDCIGLRDITHESRKQTLQFIYFLLLTGEYQGNYNNNKNTITYNNTKFSKCLGGVLNSSWGWGVPPKPSNPDPVHDEKFAKIMES